MNVFDILYRWDDTMNIKKYLITLGMILIFSFPIFSNWNVDVEISKVYGEYSDIRIPNDRGDLISLTDDLEMESIITYRDMFSKIFNKKHTVMLIYAPLKIKSQGTLSKDIYYYDSLFISGREVESVYVFNSYRLTYRYKIYDSKKINFGIGLTAKTRDAYISQDQKNTQTYSKKSNVGFVPIINFKFNYKFNPELTFNISGDVLASPYGRTEDIFTGVYYKINKNLLIKGGYRFLEGGSDVEEVYSFSYFHYIVAGVSIYF